MCDRRTTEPLYGETTSDVPITCVAPVPLCGTAGDHPKVEVHPDRADGSIHTVLHDPQDNRSRFGPLLELGSYHVVGDLPPQKTMDELGYDPYEYKLTGAAPGVRKLPYVPGLIDRLTPVPEVDEFKTARIPDFAPNSARLVPVR